MQASISLQKTAKKVRQEALRLGYQMQQGSLGISLGLFMRGMHFLVDSNRETPPGEAFRLLRSRYFELLERDLLNAEQGIYPIELLFQFPLKNYAKKLPEILADMPRVAMRRRHCNYIDLPEGISREGYPAYYARNFHWQTDGWLSERSASLYDASVELLFQGTADIMRRMAIPPLMEHFKTRNPKEGPARILDIACGTGRFLQQLQQTLPREKFYGIDLSPYYIARAKQNLKHIQDIALLTENAEQMPFQDASFDAITSVFLFHELPRDARRRVLSEIKRVLKPNGLVVICDSVQLSDSAPLKPFLDRFEALYHEPYYRSYVRDDLAQMLGEFGFQILSNEPYYLSKTVAGRLGDTIPSLSKELQ